MTARVLGLGEGELIGYDGYKHIKGTKIHAVVSSEALPLSIQIGPGDERDSNHFIPLLEGLRVECGRGRPRTRHGGVVGDSVCDTKGIREYLKRRGGKSEHRCQHKK